MAVPLPNLGGGVGIFMCVGAKIETPPATVPNLNPTHLWVANVDD